MCVTKPRVIQNKITFQTSPNMIRFGGKRNLLPKIRHFVKNGRNHGFLKDISWGFFFGHSTYKTEPSEKILAWHDFFPGLGVILASTTGL